MLGAIVVTAVLVMTLKLLFRRRRPEGRWGGIYRNTDPHSFPSGHAARAALMAALIIAWGPAWLVPIALVWAPLVALARVAMGVHYLSDGQEVKILAESGAGNTVKGSPAAIASEKEKPAKELAK